MRRLALFLLSLPLLAQTSLSVKQVSTTGVAFCYTAGDTMTAYPVQVSLDDFATVVNDFNPALFTDADLDLSRTDTVANGTSRCVQGGHAGHYFQALNGARYSRTMRHSTTYRWRVNGVEGSPFTTDNPQPNIVGTQGLPILAPFINDKPALNPHYNTKFVDAITGSEIRTLPNIFGLAWTGYTGSSGIKMGGAESSTCTASLGTLPSAMALDDNVYAQCTTQGNKIFVSLGNSDRIATITACTAANPTVCTLNGSVPDAIYPNQTIVIRGATNTTTLATTINSAATTIVFTSAGGFSTGTNFTIENETITCASLASNTFSGCTRGASGTTPAGHTSGVTITGTNLQGSWVVSAVSGTDVTVPFNGTGFTYTASSGTIRFDSMPSSSSFSGAPSFFNVKLTGDCTGCAAPLASTICMTFHGKNGACDSERKPFTFPTSEATKTLCEPHDSGANCANPEHPGDFWTFDLPDPTQMLEMGVGRVWNGASGGCASGTKLCFTDAGACAQFHVNDKLRVWQGSSGGTITVTATNCGASPPSVTMDDAWLADGNGATGVPYLKLTGSSGFDYGFIIEKTDAASGTIRIDQLRAVIGVYSGVDLVAAGAGGFPPRCQDLSLATPDGGILCAATGGFWNFKDVNGELQAKYMGSSYLFPPGGNASIWDPETFTWSNTEVGVFYMSVNAPSGNSPLTGSLKRYIHRVAFNQPDIACGEMGTTCTLPTLAAENVRGAADVTFTNLTPCLNSCSMDSDDYTLGGQMVRYAAAKHVADPTIPDYDLGRFGGGCGLKAVQGNFIICQSHEATSQDTFAVYWAFDLGNIGIPGSTYVGSEANTQQIYRVSYTYQTSDFRWCGDHTHSPVLGTTAFTVIECGGKDVYAVKMTNALTACTLGSTCAVCPDTTLRCSAIVLTSANSGGGYPSGGQPQPAAYADGDPLNTTLCDLCNPYYKWLQKLAVGDKIFIGAGSTLEYVQIVASADNTHKTVYRGCGSSYPGGDYHVRAHSADSIWGTATEQGVDCYSSTRDPNFVSGIAWDWIGERTCETLFVNHAINTNGVRITSGYGTQIGDFTNWTNICANFPAAFPTGTSTFAGVMGGPTGPNAVEAHPGYQNYAAPGRTGEYFDARPLSITDDDATITNITGDLYGFNESRYVISPKLFPSGAWMATLPFQRAQTIDGTSASRGKLCVNAVVGGCFTSPTNSLANKIYINGPVWAIYGNGSNPCASLEFWTGQMDTCSVNSTLVSAAGAVQNKLPPTSAAALTTRIFRRLASQTTYRDSATSNVKPLTDGKYLFQRNTYGGVLSTYMYVTPWPTDDGLDRRTFIPRSITIPGGSVPMGTIKARIKYGYDEGFRPNDNSDEAGFVLTASVNPSVPFKWASELVSGDGVACASGCTIELPQIEGRIARYQVLFVDGSGISTGTLPVSFDLGNPPTPSGQNGSARGGIGVKGGRKISK